MDNEKLQINLAPGMSKAELVIREGAAPKELEPKAPVKTNLKGVIGAVVEYLKKRINAGQFEQKDCHILVNRDTIELTLITNEADEYRRLMNFTADVNNKIERAVKENGNRTDNFAQMVSSNLPDSFTIQMPIFKGMPPETIEVETFAQVNGREVAFVLLSPGAQATLEDLRDKVIDEQLEQIREIAPEIAIIEV